MYYGEQCYKGVPEQDLWTLLFLGYYAKIKLNEKYDSKNKPSHISSINLCNDGRRRPTVRKFLTEKGLIDGSRVTNNTLNPIDEEVEKLLLEGFMKEPKFNTSGYLSKNKNSYSEEKVLTPVTDLEQVYVDVTDLNAYEAIYVYLHQEEYHFNIFKTTTHYKDRRNNSIKYERYFLKIYPVKAQDAMDERAYTANSETFARSHAREILTAAFDAKFRKIDDKKEYMSLAAVTSRIWDVEDKMRLLGRTLRELKVLQRKAGILGDEALQKKLMDTSAKYIKHKAPLWLNSDDEEKKNLSLLVCKGTALTLEKTVDR